MPAASSRLRRRWVDYLDVERRLQWDLQFDEGRLASLVMVTESLRGGRWVPTRRYDTCDGALHVHHGRGPPTSLTEVPLRVPNARGMLQAIERDLS